MSDTTRVHKEKRGESAFGSRLTATISITLVLLLFAIMITMGLFAHDLSKKTRESIHITVVLNDAVKPQDVQKLQKQLEKASWAKAVNYIDKESALNELTKELGYSPSELLGYNPLPATFEVNLTPEAANMTKIKELEKELTAYKGVKEVTYQENLIEVVNKNILSITKVLLLVAALLTLISFVLIRNTVRLIIYAKRHQIHTMCLVGAKYSYIRRPFVNRNVVSGFVSGLLATGLYYLSVMGLDKVFPGISDLVDLQTIVLVFVIIEALGITISAVSTVSAVNHFLRMSDDEMYRV